MSAVVMPLATRSSNGFRVTKTAPEFGALVKVAPSKPAKPAVWAVPSTDRAMLASTSRTTLSVRSIDEPGGSWIAVIR